MSLFEDLMNNITWRVAFMPGNDNIQENMNRKRVCSCLLLPMAIAFVRY